MATGVKDLRIYQLGVEDPIATPVATTTRWIGNCEIAPDEPTFRADAQTGVLVEGGGIKPEIATRMANVTLDGDLTFQQLLHVGHMSMKGGITPGTVGTTGKQYVFNPTYLADPGLDAFTLDRRLTDGTTTWDETVAGMMARSFNISAAIGENTKISVDAFGKPILRGETLTAAVAVPTVAFVPASLWKVYIDDTAGGIGGTQLACDVISFSFDYESMVQPKFFLSGAADKSFCGYGLKRAKWGLTLQVEIDAAIIAEQADAASQAIRYVRLEAIGAAIAGGSAFDTITIDLPLRHATGMFDQSGDRDGNDTATLEFVDAYDSATPLGAKMSVTVVNATLP